MATAPLLAALLPVLIGLPSCGLPADPQEPVRPVAARRDPDQAPLALLRHGLLEQLRQADRRWIPRIQRLPDGRSRYLYLQRPGDPEPSIAELQRRIGHPPSHEAERQAIVRLLTLLDRLGVALSLAEPLRAGAAAEWDPARRSLRIRPDVRRQGTLEFARVLNHEAIHVAQSCAAGGIGAEPIPLVALPLSGDGEEGSSPFRDGAVDHEAMRSLQDPIYADLSSRERRLEREAYGLQNRLHLGERLVRIHCLTGRRGGAGASGSIDQPWLAMWRIRSRHLQE